MDSPIPSTYDTSTSVLYSFSTGRKCWASHIPVTHSVLSVAVHLPRIIVIIRHHTEKSRLALISDENLTTQKDFAACETDDIWHRSMKVDLPRTPR